MQSGVGYLVLGIALFILGTILLVAGILKGRRTTSASNGSVAVGGNSTGNITNINVGATGRGSDGRALVIVGVLLDAAAVVLTLVQVLAKASP